MSRSLEAQLREDPDDESAWLVYRDWLIENRSRHRGDLVCSGRELSQKQRQRFRGAAALKSIVRWKHSFVVAIELPIDTRTPARLREILAHREGRLVSSLQLKRWEYRDDAYFGSEVVGDPPSDDVLAEIFAVDLRRLRRLSLAYNVRQPPRHILELAKAKLAITTLDLRYCGVTDELVEQLVMAPWFRGVRRLYLQGNALTDASARLLAASTDRIELVDVRYTQISSLAARDMRAQRMISDDDARTLSSPEPARPTCARVVSGPGGFTTEYVDPTGLTFRTLENIIPLDELVEPRELALTDHVEAAPEVHRFRLAGELPDFDALPLYTTPVNAQTRGGQRYVFHSAHLADALTKAVRAVLPMPGFSHVNPVFRCNRFEPGDADFHAHLDTPYFDAARHHVSKYTLLIYLTAGTGSPALKIEDVALASLAAMTAIIFHQAYEHTGRAYTEGRKVFLRSELVFEDDKLAHDPRIAAAFSKACYLTGESVRAPGLARDADALYNQVAAAHWGAPIRASSEPFVHKQFRDIHWLANGYDFWFPRTLPLADCAAITLLDYFNCTLDGQPFRRHCTIDGVSAGTDPDAFLANHRCAPLPALDPLALFPSPERNLTCCPTHCRASYDATVSEDVIALYANAQRFARERIEAAPIVMLGHDVYLHRARFLVEGGVLHVLSRERLAPVNFAACWNSEGTPPNFLDVDVPIDVLHPLVPPILWSATAATHHLMFDFFRNGWAVGHEQYTVPVPRIRRVDAVTIDENDQPWLEAARMAHPDDKAPPLAGQPYWAHHTSHAALLRDLFRKR